VLRLVARGYANKTIARELGNTERTDKAHVGSILGKLHLESRTQAALLAGRIGLVSLDRVGTAPSRELRTTRPG
jgi:DNA-binding NarL/FixJ family response regulator